DGACNLAAAGGVDFFRILLVRDPQHLVEPVDAPVAGGAVGVVEVIAEAARVDAAVAGALIRRARVAAVERPQRRGAAPGVPIELLGHLDGGKGLLRTPGVIHEAAHHADLADLAGADEIAAADVVRRDAAMRAHLHHAAGGARGVHHRAALDDGVRDR